MGAQIDEGFHSYKTTTTSVNVECIIPKGATYYENEEQYVSDQIKFIQILDYNYAVQEDNYLFNI